MNQNNNNKSNELTKKNKKYNLKNDIIFKAFFARPGNEIFLIDFLEALLKIKIEKIKIKEEVNLEQLSVEEKGGRLDLQATLNDGIIVNIELQMNNNFNIEERTTLYSSKVNSRDAKRGTNYSEINKVIMINILGYNLLDVEEYISETVIVLDKHRDYEVLKGIKWYFIELPKFRKKNPDMNDKIDQWICFIDDSNKEAVKMAEKNNVVLKKARKELNYLTGDAAVRRMAELREKWEMDEIAVKKHAERIGKEEGRREGRLEGKSEERADIILKMHKKGYSLEQIMDVTEMSEAEIKAIIE